MGVHQTPTTELDATGARVRHHVAFVCIRYARCHRGLYRPKDRTLCDSGHHGTDAPFGIRNFVEYHVRRQSEISHESKYTPLSTQPTHFCIDIASFLSNNVERRLGVSVIALYGLWLTKALTAYLFYQIDPRAGKWLAATLTWITAAAALETRTWQINPDPSSKEREPLYPAKGKAKTLFRWESS